MRVYVFEALLLFALAAFVCCAATPPARLPVRPDCLAPSEKCPQGWVIVEVDVSPSGTVDHAEIVEVCPDDSFNWTALQSVKDWRWNPSSDGKQDHQMKLCRP